MQIYRKRYELLQLVVISRDAITPEIQLQYRKRYELLQHCIDLSTGKVISDHVTIPQAV